MLRLSSRSRNRNVKNKHSKKIEKNTQEKSKYEEDYKHSGDFTTVRADLTDR